MSCTKDCRKPSGRMAHCGACHRTFGGITGFDDHRKGGRCNDPVEVNMHERSGVWRSNDQHPRSAGPYTPLSD